MAEGREQEGGGRENERVEGEREGWINTTTASYCRLHRQSDVRMKHGRQSVRVCGRVILNDEYRV